MVVLGNSGEPLGKIQVTRVDVVSFDKVPDEFALVEAEGDLSGYDFRVSHSKFWTSCGFQVTPESQVVLVYFDLMA